MSGGKWKGLIFSACTKERENFLKKVFEFFVKTHFLCPVVQ